MNFVTRVPAPSTLARLLLLAGLFAMLRLDSGQPLHSSPAASYSALTSPELEIRLRQDQLTIAAHTVSSEHERRILAAASGRDRSPVLDFRPLGTAPGHWMETTERLIDTLAAGHAVTARLRDGALHMRAVVANPTEWQRRMQRLREILPASAQDDIRLTVVEQSPGVHELCAAAFARFRSDRVNFDESGVQLRVSAYPALDRVIALADACRDAQLSIVGHTDASGDEAFNEALSLARARTVADYLVSRGIAQERLAVAGAGSTSPIADNGTRYGRSLNRRIEFAWRVEGDGAARPGPTRD